ncbi:hypothetical protein KC19_5G056800 [Ceratodon purpureus]|uniref:Uncharacterized protein n=1 Tax=Ceratodon purpureus TaxID=3225 RepID=A0A8T0HZP8_CERPU|nr:hypothetical protein KC19_5G056800 [Ceratodon purpureus]
MWHSNFLTSKIDACSLMLFPHLRAWFSFERCIGDPGSSCRNWKLIVRKKSPVIYS